MARSVLPSLQVILPRRRRPPSPPRAILRSRPLWRRAVRPTGTGGSWGAGLTAGAAALLLLFSGAPSLAQTAPAPPAATGSPSSSSAGAKTPCVMVDIAGHRTGDLDCTNQTLAKVAGRAQAATTPQVGVPTIGSSPTALGEANVAATRERLGSSFGTSVIPQRPVQTYAPPLGRPPR